MAKVRLTLSRDARQMKRRIRRTRCKAQFAGFLYIIGILLLAGLAALPTLNVSGIAVMGDNVALWEKLDNLGANIDTISRALYALLLLSLVISVFKGLSYLGWLFTSKASVTYGMNRNVYAMQGLGKVFSRVFFRIISVYFVIVLLNGSYASALTDFAAFDGILLDNMFVAGIPNIVLIVAVGVALHFLCGWVGANVSLFTVGEDAGIVEECRRVGRFAPLVRNILQVAVAFAISYLVLKTSVVNVFVESMLVGGAGEIDLLPIFQIVLVVCWLVLMKHAMNTTEFNADGANGAGMKNFTLFIGFTAIVSAVIYYMNADIYGSFDFENEAGLCVLAIEGLALVMSIIQFMMIKLPALPEDRAKAKQEKKEKKQEKKQAKKEKKQAKKEKREAREAAREAEENEALEFDAENLDVDFFFADGYVV